MVPTLCLESLEGDLQFYRDQLSSAIELREAEDCWLSVLVVAGLIVKYSGRPVAEVIFTDVERSCPFLECYDQISMSAVNAWAKSNGCNERIMSILMQQSGWTVDNENERFLKPQSSGKVLKLWQ